MKLFKPPSEIRAWMWGITFRISLEDMEREDKPGIKFAHLIS